MKFSFINASPNEGIDEREGRKSIAAFPPLGILYLATMLEQADIEVSVLDQPALGFTVNDTLQWVQKEKPDIIGFSALASSGQMAAHLSQKIKQQNSDITTVIGNHYATFNAERILTKYPSVDIVVRGEAEETIVPLADTITKGNDLEEIRGITYRKNGNIVANPNQPQIKDLNTLPFPDRKLLNIEYHSLIAGATIAPKKFTGIISSRGCTYGCRFCSCTEFAHNRWRPRTAKNTLEELQQLSNDGYKQLVFVDDSFTLNPKRTMEICKAMQKEKLDFEWICEGRVDNANYELLREMVKAGLKVLYFGIENANPRILDYYKKKITPEQAEKAVRIAKKAGVDVIVGSFIMGAPDETRAEMQNTINFIKHIPIDIPQFSILGAHPGNDIWREMVAEGFLNPEEHWETGIAVSAIVPTAVPLEEIRTMVNQAFFSYIARPKFIAKQIAKTLKSNYRLNVMLSNLTRLGSINEDLHTVA
ncbi:radical SAM protein [Candidatus Bathyarchaeota archaeon]|nr:radical SAM protein [Candidatus Bathyarchaeota archaeon]